jgi:hypothetical protein
MNKCEYEMFEDVFEELEQGLIGDRLAEFIDEYMFRP